MKTPHFFKITLGSLALLFCAGISTASAQFEGTLEINRYSVSENGNESLNASHNLSLSPTNILFSKSEDAEALDMMGAIEASSIIIRHDAEDFVFMGNRSEAVVLKKEELLSMISLMNNVRGMGDKEQNADTGLELTQTSETKNIDGYDAQKWLMQSEDSDEVFHVWLTEEINIEWGLLSEPWLTDLTLFSDLPFADLMSQGKTPIQVERFVNDTLTDRFSLENIEEKNLPNNHFDIPEGTEVVNFQQLLMKRMSGR
ncbi:MAG: hypothetical protein WD038_02940 [Balneolales bacterium]